MNAKDTANNIPVDFNAESQRDLLGDAGAAAVRIATFQFNDCGNEFLIRSFGARLAPALEGKQHAVLSFDQQLVETQKSGRLQHNCGT